MIRRLGALGVLSLSVLLLAACGGEERLTEPDKLVPAGSNLIAEVQLAKILADSDLKDLFGALPDVGEIPGSLEEVLDLVIEETGVDPRQFDSLVIFARFSGFDEDTEGALILRGSFDEEMLVEAIEMATRGGLEESEYKEHRIYLGDDEDNAFSVVEKGTLVLGSLEGVRSVIDVRVGDADPFSGPLADTLGELGDVLFKLALEVPEEAKQDFGQDFDFDFNILGEPPLVEAFQDVQTVALSVDRVEDDLVFEAWADFTPESSAADTTEGLEAVLTLVRLSLGEELGDLLRKVKVSADGTRLTVRSEVTVEEIKDAVMSLLGGLPALFSGGVLGGQGEQDSQFRREVAPVPAVREGTPAPVRVIRAAPLPGSPRFLVIANYRVLADAPPAELVHAATERTTSFLGAVGLSGGTGFGNGVFAVEMLDVFDLEQAMGLLTGLAFSFRMELIDVRAERVMAEGVQAVPPEGARPQGLPVEATPAPVKVPAVREATLASVLEKIREQLRAEVAPTPVPVPAVPPQVVPTPAIVPAAPRPGSPRFIAIARYEVLADPSAEQLDETSHMILLGLEQMGITGGTSVTQDGVFEVEMRDVNLERAMFLLGSLASDGLPLPLELIDARAERIKVEGER